MNTFTESKSIKVKISLIALTANFLAILSNGQEPAVQLLHDAKATFGIVSNPKQEELDKPIVELGRICFGTSAYLPTARLHVPLVMLPKVGARIRKGSRLMQRARLPSETRKLFLTRCYSRISAGRAIENLVLTRQRNRSPVRWDSQMPMMLRYCSNNTAMSPCFSVRFPSIPNPMAPVNYPKRSKLTRQHLTRYLRLIAT